MLIAGFVCVCVCVVAGFWPVSSLCYSAWTVDGGGFWSLGGGGDIECKFRGYVWSEVTWGVARTEAGRIPPSEQPLQFQSGYFLTDHVWQCCISPRASFAVAEAVVTRFYVQLI